MIIGVSRGVALLVGCSDHNWDSAVEKAVKASKGPLYSREYLQPPSFHIRSKVSPAETEPDRDQTRLCIMCVVCVSSNLRFRHGRNPT